MSVTKGGNPVATASFAEVDSLLGSILREEDLVDPIGDLWDAEQSFRVRLPA